MHPRYTDVPHDAENSPYPHALVLGNGLSGAIASRALLDLGLAVTLVRISRISSALFCSAPLFDSEHYNHQLLSEKDKDLEILDVVEHPAIRREAPGFIVSLGKDKQSFFGCIIVTSRVSLRNQENNLPAGVEQMGTGVLSGQAERIVFLLDYLHRSDPAIGMAAIKKAIDNQMVGGHSFVLFQHAPVTHIFGESLYERARRAGVQFVRFGSELPSVRKKEENSRTPLKFTLTVRDSIEMGEKLEFHCNRVVVASSPDGASIPNWALDFAAHDVDDEGFLLSASIHCHSGRSFANGIFAVGECTGNVDLIRVIEQARSTAVRARAWMRRAALVQNEKTVVSSEECIRCLTCYRICPHSAVSLIGMQSRFTVEACASFCEQCGICVSECPRMALDLESFPEQNVSAFLTKVRQTSPPLSMVLYGCERTAARLVAKIKLPPDILFFSFPCAGRISEAILWATLASGVRGVLVLGCHHDNCASDSGTDWARVRVEAVLEKLASPGRIPLKLKYATVSAKEPARFRSIVEQYANYLRDGAGVKPAEG